MIHLKYWMLPTQICVMCKQQTYQSSWNLLLEQTVCSHISYRRTVRQLKHPTLTTKQTFPRLCCMLKLQTKAETKLQACSSMGNSKKQEAAYRYKLTDFVQ